MSKADRKNSNAPPPAGDRFDSWKEIAGYLKKSVRTVQRWEKEEKLPVHRHKHLSMGSVYAFREELDRWFQERRDRPMIKTGGEPGRPSGSLSLAVLPFRRLSQEEPEARLAELLSEELVGALAALPGVRVASPAVIQAQAESPLTQIARTLELQYALEGSVRLAGESVRVQVRILEAATGLTLTTRNFPRRLTDVAAGCERLAQQIAAEVREELRRQGDAPAIARPALARVYWEAQRLMGERTRSSLQEARHRLEAAEGAHPGDGLVQAALSECAALMGVHGYLDPREAFHGAEQAAQRAVELQPESPEAHAALGLVRLFFDRDWDQAEAALLEALALRPEYPAARCWLSMNLAVMGRPFEAIEQVRMATQQAPGSIPVQAYIAGGYYYAGQFEAAASKALEIVANYSEFPTAHLFLGRALTHLRRFEEAEPPLRRAVETSENSAEAVGALAHMLALSGRSQEAEEVLEEHRRMGYYLGAGQRAAVAVARGRPKRALAELALALEEHFPGLVLLKIDPVWNPLRGSPDFEELLRQVGLVS